MNYKMKFELSKLMDKWLSAQTLTDEWEELSFFCPSGLEEKMTEAASLVFDAAVEASKFAEESAR